MDRREWQRAFALLTLVGPEFPVPTVNIVHDPDVSECVPFDPLDYLQLFRRQVDRCAESQESTEEAVVGLLNLHGD